MSERSEKEILESVEERLAALHERLDGLGAQSPAFAPEPEEDPRFERRLNLFVIGGTAASAALTWVFWRYLPPFFPIAFGIFFVFLILSVGLAIDEFVLPVHTFRRISTHAIAVALFWLSIVFLAVSGVELGTSIISDPFGGEEGRPTTVIVEQEADEPRPQEDRPVGADAGGGEGPDAAARPQGGGLP